MPNIMLLKNFLVTNVINRMAHNTASTVNDLNPIINIGRKPNSVYKIFFLIFFRDTNPLIPQKKRR